MRAIVYDQPGDPAVLRLVDRPVPRPGPGEVRLRVAYSGVNPTDWKSRRSAVPGEERVANHDGSGSIDAVGPGVIGFHVNDRAWTTLAGYQRPAGGTAQEYTVVPVDRVFLLPAGASLELGASLGVPALTAHQALVSAQRAPAKLTRGCLEGWHVLVAGGAGAVGNAAIQLARWAGATVIATVSNPEKADLAAAAGAHHIVNYHDSGAAAQIRAHAPEGVQVVVEVALAANVELDNAVLAQRGTIVSYATDAGGTVTLQLGAEMSRYARYQFVLLYLAGWDAVRRGAQAVNDAIADGAFRVGREAGLPLHHFPLADTAGAHAAVEAAAVGKVLVDLGQ